MSGRGRLTLCAYAATLAASCAMAPLVDGVGWLVHAAFLLGLQSAAGALARRVPLARALTVLAQALAGLLLLTLSFAREQALFGVLPGPQAFEHFGALLSTGGQDIGRYAVPAPATDGISLMLVGGVLAIGVVVDSIAVTFRSAAPAGLPLLALYSVAAGLSGGASWVWFLVASSGYLLLLLAEGRDRLSRWGRVFGSPRPSARGAQAFEPPTATARTGRRIGVIALGVALVAPAALPTMDGGLLAGMGAGSGSGGDGGGTISAVNPLVSLKNDLNRPEDREVLRYVTEPSDAEDFYLRIVALDEFDGTTWSSSKRDVEDVPKRLPAPQGLDPSVEAKEISTSISSAGYYRQNWLPMPYPATEVKIDGRWRYEPAGRTLVGDRGEDTGDAKYLVRSLQVKPTPKQLADAPPAPAGLRREYTEVPRDLPSAVPETARQVTRGARNDYERAVRLQDWFSDSGGFTYSTSVDSGTGRDAITRFLRDKQGFCIHFSFSMAAMARTLGIPARVAVGFTPGTKLPDGTRSVGVKDAHAWPELYFEGVGWTRFEPTPSRGAAPDYSLAETAPNRPSGPATPTAPGPDRERSTPTASDDCPAEARRAEECGPQAPTASDESSASDGAAVTVLLIVLGGLAALVVPLLPLLWRRRIAARRLRGGGRRPEEIRERVLAAWREALDTAWDFGIEPDESQTPRGAAVRIILLGRLEGRAAEAVHRLAGGVEQVLYAPRPQPVMALIDDVALVRGGLRAGAGRRARLRALLLPRSAVQVIWAASAARTAFAHRQRQRAARWRAALPQLPSRQRG